MGKPLDQLQHEESVRTFLGAIVFLLGVIVVQLIFFGVLLLTINHNIVIR